MNSFWENLRLRLLEKFIRLFWWADAYLSHTPSLKTKSNYFFTGLEPLVLSLIISGVAFGANLAVQLLLSPKPKIAPKQKLNGELSLSDSAWGLPLYRIHGGRGADGIGGIEVGTNIIFCSDIRKIEVPVPGTTTTSGRGKGGGGNKQSNTQTQELLKCDMGAAIGAGRLRLLRLKLNEDVVFDQSKSVISEPSGTKYEAEAASRAGTASVETVTGFSNSQGVTNLNSTGTLTFSLTGSGLDTPIHIGYRSSTDVTCAIVFGGETIVYSFPATGNLRGWRTIYKFLPSGANSFKLQSASSANLKIDCAIVETPLEIIQPEDLYYRPTGLYDENQSSPYEKNNLIFPETDYRSLENINRYNLPVYEQNVSAGIGDVNGVITATLSNGAQMTFYPGSEDQPVDPTYAAWVASQPGKTADFAQAFLGTSWVCLKDLDFTKWGAFPNVRALVENMDTGTVAEILLAEGLLIPDLNEDDFDFTAAEEKLCRGYIVTNNDPPQKTFEDLAIIFNLGYTEGNNGKLTVIDKNVRIPVATIPKDDLGAYNLDEQQTPPQDLVITTMPDESDMPRTMEIQFFNPLPPINFGTDRREHPFPFTNSVKKDTISVNVTLLPEESQKVVKRLNQEKWLKLAPERFNLTHKYAWLEAGNCISVEIENQNKLLRIERFEGSAPGIFEVVATNDELYVSADGTEIEIELPKETIQIPAATLGTLMELPPMFDGQTPGIHVACCPIGPGNWTGAVLYRNKGVDFQQLVTFNKKALMGRCVSALGNVPGGYEAGDVDTTNTLIVDFYNNFTPDTVTSDQQEDGANMYVVGNEIVYVRTWTRDNDYPNRWQGTNLIRQGKGTISTGHAIGERCVYFSDAVKFLPIEPQERDVERTWKFVTAGESIEAAAPIIFAVTNLDLLVNNKVIEDGIDRARTGLDGGGGIRGKDTGLVPLSAITAYVSKAVVFDNGINVDVNVMGEVAGAKVVQSAQGDSINQSDVKVFNKFGEPVYLSTDPAKAAFGADGFTGAGTLGKGTIPRKYADPIDEAFFEIRIKNWWGFSPPKYLKGSTLSNSIPALIPKSSCPLDLSAVPLSESSIRFAGTFGGFGTYTLTLKKRKVGTADWSNHVTGITALPYDATALPALEEYDFQMVSSQNSAYSSNIVRAKTLQTGSAAPTRPAPSGLVVDRDSVSPTSKIVAYWSRNATDNTGVIIEVNGVESTLGASDTSEEWTSLAENTTKSIRVRNTWGTGDHSLWTELKSATTAVTPPSALPPRLNYAYITSYNTNDVEILVNFTPRGGSAGYSIYYNTLTTDDIYAGSAASGDISFNFNVDRPEFYSESIQIFVYVIRDDVAGESDQIELTIPKKDEWYYY